jgi:hypothetical protein
VPPVVGEAEPPAFAPEPDPPTAYPPVEGEPETDLDDNDADEV